MAMKLCKDCGTEISTGAKTCPKCGKDQRNFFVKHKILSFILVVILIAIIASIGGDPSSNKNISSSTQYSKNKKVEVTVIDFSSKTKDEIENWCNDNKINYTIDDEYSNSVDKGKFISQSIEADKVIYQGDKINVKFSLGKEPSAEQKTALNKAEAYSQTMNMSKKGIYNQLTSSIEGFTKDAAQYAIDNIDADWNENALKKAETYSQTMNMSKKGIYNQLTSSVEGFTAKEAQYAIDNIDANWNENALKKAETYSQTMSMSKKGIYNQLTSSVEGFTAKEAQYAIDHLNN